MKKIISLSFFTICVLFLTVTLGFSQKKTTEVQITGHIYEPAKLAPTVEKIKSLKLPNGFQIAKFAEIANPRMLAVSNDGTVYVSQRDPGTLSMLKDTNADGVADIQKVVAEKKGLHGVAIDGNKIYIVTVKEIFVADIKPDGTSNSGQTIYQEIPLKKKEDENRSPEKFYFISKRIYEDRFVKSENSLFQDQENFKFTQSKSKLIKDFRIDKTSPEEKNYRHQRGEKHIGVELGLSPLQPTFLSGEKEYDTTGRKFSMISFRWGRVIGTAKGITVDYEIEIIPVALAFKNEVINPNYIDEKNTPDESETLRQTTYGWGFSPVGFRFLFLPQKRLKPFLATHAGFIFFRKPVPMPNSLTYDFTGDFGGGVQYQLERDKAVTFGYKYFHISNINIGEINPGYNANVFYIGYSFFYK